ncbi:VWA domain-containing protein [Candidatus Woesearchaeota archaeon]|nr:VWA domain-containing protein [Candidatus Woesearchaeota archaeon]
MEIAFNNPDYLWFLLSIPLFIIIYFITERHSKKKALKFANYEAISRITGESIVSTNIVLLIIRVVILGSIILAISGTVLYYIGPVTDADFVLAIDSSSSMTANDLNPTRLEAAKREAINFVDNLPGKTSIGIISFSGAAFVEQELTDNMNDAKTAIRNIETKGIGGTDLGEALVIGVNTLLPSKKTKVLILLTDGQSNIGIPVEQAIKYVNKNNVIVHTIGIGTTTGGQIGGLDVVSKLDEEKLQAIALTSYGSYFRATDESSLSQAYKILASTTQMRTSKDLSPILTLTALIVIFLEWVLSSTRYKVLFS